jgi:hypothetical protein
MNNSTKISEDKKKNKKIEKRGCKKGNYVI